MALAENELEAQLTEAGNQLLEPPSSVPDLLDVLDVPLYVATKMASIRRSSFFVPSTDGYARAALRWIGYEPRCTPYWPHTLLWGLACSLPESVVDAWRLRFCLRIRKRGQLKDSSRKQE